MALDDKRLIAQILSPGDNHAAIGAQAAAERDKAGRLAYAQLVKRYQGLVLTIIFALVKNEETARDLTQETFLKAFRSLKQFDNSRSFKPWLLKIANNTALDYLRSKQNREEVSLELIIEEEPGLEPYDSKDPSMIAENNLFIEKLAAALRLLPLRYRQAFVLRYQMDLSYDEIAEVMQESENNVRTLLFRARDRLRKLIISPDKAENEPAQKKQNGITEDKP